MGDIKIKQHYVWRHYLKPWAIGESVWTYFKELDKIEQPGLMGVAQEKHFYKLIELSDEEEHFLKEYIEHTSPITVKSLNFDFLRLFTTIYKIRKTFEENNDPEIDKEAIEAEIKRLEHDLMEDAHCKIEALGFNLLSCKNINDLKYLNESTGLHDTIMFLCFQLVRTKRSKESVLESFKNTHFEKLAQRTWNIVSYITATTMASCIALNKKLRFITYENSTDNHFITGDQPIFNILSDKLNENGDVAEMEIYYPVSPQFALTIHYCSDQKDKFVNKLVDDEMINYLNKKVFENSDFFVFADTKEQLEKIRNL